MVSRFRRRTRYLRRIHALQARTTLFAISITLALAGCQDAARPVSPNPTMPGTIGPMMSQVADIAAPLVLHLVAPQTTDPAITWAPAVSPALANHYVWLDPSARGNPKLLVFMPGAGNVPPVGSSSSRRPRAWAIT